MPHELKERMRAVRHYVNWSEVARTAFEAKLSELVSEQEVQEIDEVVDRLRRFQQQMDSSSDDWFKSGFELGRRWAMNQAAPDQLERIEQLREDVSADEWKALFDDETGPQCGWRQLAYAIDPSSDPENGARGMRAKRVMRETLGLSKVDDLHYMRGFAEGGIEVWKAVKDKL